MKTYLAVAAAGALFAWSGWMCRAERYQKLAENARAGKNFTMMAQDYNRAAQINRWDFYYTQCQLDYLYSIYPLIPRRDLNGLMTISEQIAERAVRLHPNDPSAHEALASALLFQSQARRRPQRFSDIDRELRTAQELAPLFPEFGVRRASLPFLMRKN